MSFTSSARSSNPKETAMTYLCIDTAKKPAVMPSITLWNDKAATTKTVRKENFASNPDSVPFPLIILDTRLSSLGRLESPDMLSNK